jgi:GT2 family glycosyltransferase
VVSAFPRAVNTSNARPTVRGKFLSCDGAKFYVRGATYGAFAPGPDGTEYHDLSRVERDFEQMAENGLNSVRIPHTMPPVELLDAAQVHGLKVMVGLSAEQYAGYLTDRKGAPNIEQLVRAKVRSCAGHPALLCYALGNEIPASTVRWLGRRRMERYLERLFRAVKAEDPGGLVTYVNYPSTEYLKLPFLDLVSFNVYLEQQDRLAAYLSRLHNLAGDRPLLMSEVGLDAMRNGEDRQAEALEWQIRTIFGSGGAGAFIFSWTDEWYRAGEPVTDWAFGITDADRRPKPALAAVRDAFAAAPLAQDRPTPRISVIVCTHNGNRTLTECLKGLRRLEYPDFEVIVVDDGSDDAGAAANARDYGFTVLRRDNEGLSSARNLGLAHASGEIVAYLDDDAYPDPHWLTYLADAFMSTEHVAVGGPNIPPAGDGWIAECVSHAPGGPIHVLLSDQEAEHIPGCNMAFRRAALEAIGGFDPQFRVAGDDVDVCWRLQERGWTLGFHPSAVVWHHRRNSLRAYWRQQKNYGKAEALLERKWPEKYNTLGHVSWAGRVYGNGHAKLPRLRANRIYHGIWGSAPFQSLYERAPSLFASLPAMPEWHLLLAALAAVGVLGILWTPLLLGLPLLGLAVAAPVAQAVFAAARTEVRAQSRVGRLKMRAVTSALHLAQPIARLVGRLSFGLTPWRRSAAVTWMVARPRSLAIWSESWLRPEDRLSAIEAWLRAQESIVLHGGAFDRWDLEVRGGILAGCRLRAAVEDHGASHQLVRVRIWPRWSPAGILSALVFAALAAAAALDGALSASAILGGLALLLVLVATREAGASAALLLDACKAHLGYGEERTRFGARRWRTSAGVPRS